MVDIEPEDTLTSLEFQLLKETRMNAPFRAAFEHSPVGFALLTIDDHFLEANAAFTRLLGYTRDELLATRLDRLAHQDDRGSDHAEREATLAGKLAYYQIEKRYLHKSGSVVHCLLNVSLIRSSAGEPAYFVAQLVDLTAQKRLLADLKRANEELQHFAAVISHDLKAPLRAIHTLLRWLDNDYADQLSAEAREIVHTVMERAERMDAMILGLLEYSRLSSRDEQRAEIDLNVLVHDVVAMIVPSDHFDVEIVSSLPTIRANPYRIQQVFQNLIDNAVKFSDKEHGLIRIGCEREDNYWRFWVQDNGPGIDPANRQRVFELFQKAPTARPSSGSGIGLAIVKRIVETEGGKIWVNGDDLTTFFFTLPIGQTDGVAVRD